MSEIYTSESPRLRFGDAEHQTVPADVAEQMMKAWRRRRPVEFGQELARAMVGDDAVKPARNGRAS